MALSTVALIWSVGTPAVVGLASTTATMNNNTVTKIVKLFLGFIFLFTLRG
jgi:hypothetical protein